MVSEKEYFQSTINIRSINNTQIINLTKVLYIHNRNKCFDNSLSDDNFSYICRNLYILPSSCVSILNANPQARSGKYKISTDNGMIEVQKPKSTNRNKHQKLIIA